MKGSLRGKMPGDNWKQLAGVRAFTAYQLAHPGKKLTFMGAELGQWHEWDFAGQLDWYLLDNEENRQTLDFFIAINRFYMENSPLWAVDCSWDGFDWLVPDDNHNNVVAFLRRDGKGEELVCVINFSPNAYGNYRIGVPYKECYREVFNTDEARFGGSGMHRNMQEIKTEYIPSHGRECSINVTIPPLGAVFFTGTREEMKKTKEEARQ